jgi:hypothetical protein
MNVDELELYKNDRPKWLAIVAPKQAERMNDDTYDDAVLAAVWSGMQRDYQTAVWAQLSDPARNRVRKLRMVDADAKRRAK